MSTRIASADRTLLLAGGILLMVMLAASVVLSPPSEQIESPVPSTYSPQSAGAEAAYRLLRELHYPVRRWERPPSELDTPAPSTLLILAEPTELPSAKERKALEEFVRKGGHVLFTGPNLRNFFPGDDPFGERPDPSWHSYAPILPSALMRGAPRILLGPRAYWTKLEPNQLGLYGEPNSSVVVLWSMGEGQILWWAGSTPLTNAGIAREANLFFFLNSVGNWRGNRPYQIAWDEYFHGQRNSLWSYFAKTSLAWGAVQIAILGLAVLFTFSRRSGPVFLPAERSRLSPLEFVDTLGGLYERARAAPSAISVSLKRLRVLLTGQLGVRTDMPSSELALAAAARLGWKDPELGATLARAEAAGRARSVSSTEALEIVRRLEGWAEKLEPHSEFRREKS